MSKPTPDFFPKEVAQRYDERNSKLLPISECMHFLIRIALRELPTKSKALCVGVGTGAEILSLSREFPQWSFVALDPSAEMLNVCRERLEKAGITDRCEFVHGYVQDLPNGESFDVALSILVAHFVKREDRLEFFQNMTGRLRPGGALVNTEISFDLNSPEFPTMLKAWEGIQTLMGATPESLATLPVQMKEMLSVLPPEETITFLKQSGISIPVRFFQAFMICGWFGRKSSPHAQS